MDIYDKLAATSMISMGIVLVLGGEYTKVIMGVLCVALCVFALLKVWAK